MEISLIAAIGNRHELGKNNQLLCRLPKDLEHFKKTTWGTSVIMGRKTFDSLQQQALQGRHNIILTQEPQKIQESPFVSVATTLEASLLLAKKDGVKNVMIIGGAMIYELFLPLAQYLILTRIKGNFDADVFFPSISFSEWSLEQSRKQAIDEKHAYELEWQTWKKK